MRAAILTTMICVLLVTCGSAAETKGSFSAKVSEVTVFKDGHALVLRSGRGVPVNGELVTTAVPEPVLGTFFALVEKDGPQISSVSVGWRDFEEQVPCTTMAEILRANTGKTVLLKEKNGEVRGTLLSVGEREDASESRGPQPGVAPYYDRYRGIYVQPAIVRSLNNSRVTADFVAVRGTEGTSFVKLANVESFRISGGPVMRRTRRGRRRTLTVRFDRDTKGKPVRVSFVSLERGIRWIPEYRIETMPGEKKARVRLQATVINDILDLEGVRANFVVGVPNFPLAGRLSPLALADAPRQLSTYFSAPRSGSPGGGYNQFSNAIMTQVRTAPRTGTAPGGNPLPESVMGAGKATDSGDLYVYHVERLQLAKGARSCLNLWDEQLPCSSVYDWKVEAPAPGYIWRHFDNSRRRELEARLAEPKVMHALRLHNTTDRPLTTGPALIFRKGQVLGQEIVTYTAPGGSVDVPITVAVNVNSSVTDEEVKVTRNAVTISGDAYSRADCRSRLRLVNGGKKRISVSVSRPVPGIVDSASDEGRHRRLAGGATSVSYHWPWYGYWSWPYWWWRANSVSRVSWDVELKPGETKEVTVDWHYFFRP